MQVLNRDTLHPSLRKDKANKVGAGKREKHVALIHQHNSLFAFSLFFVPFLNTLLLPNKS